MSYLGDEFGYCSYYKPWKHDYFETCCKSIPCCKYKTIDLKVFFQKSHDFELTDPVGVADLNIVQIREPVERLFSNFELFLKQQPEEDSLQGFQNFALREYYYYVAFWNKWVAPPMKKRMILTYADLTSKPGPCVRRILRRAGIEIDSKVLRKVIAPQKQSAGGAKKYIPRDVSAHAYYDLSWVENYERRISSACSGYQDRFVEDYDRLSC